MEIQHLSIEKESVNPGGRMTYLVRNNQNGRYIRLGMPETKFLLEQLRADRYCGSLGMEDSPAVAEKLKETLKNKFEEWGFLSEDAKRAKRTSFEAVKKIVLLRFNVSSMLKVIYPAYSRFFSVPGFIVLLALTVFDVGYLVHSFLVAGVNGAVQASAGFALGWKDLIFAYGFLLVSTFFHEFAHAVTCTKYGGEVKGMGLLLYYFIPCFYCDVSSVYTFKNKRHRALVAVSGILANLFISVLAIFTAIVLSWFGVYWYLLLYVGIMGIFICIYNLIPFVKFDGYWLLVSLLGLDNLMDKAVILAYTSVFKRKKLKGLSMKRGKRLLVSFYGIVSLFFAEIFWVTTMITIKQYIPGGTVWYYTVFGLIICLVTVDLVKTLQYYSGLIKNDYERMLATI